MVLEILNKLEEMKTSWQATAKECEDFGDTSGACYSRGVVAGINDSIEKIKNMLDAELTKMAAGN